MILTPRCIALLTLCWAGSAFAQHSAAHSTTYKCVDAAGHTLFTNTDAGAGCRKMNGIDTLGTTLPPPEKPATPALAKTDGAKPSASTGDRQRILEGELRAKEAELSALKKDFNGGQPERQGDEKNYQRYLDRTEHMKSEIARLEGDVSTLRGETSRLAK